MSLPALVTATRRPLLTVLGFSLAINLSLLAPSLFMLQVYDRVLTTRSVETLVLMAVLALTTLVLMGVLEYWRARSLGAIGILVEQQQGEGLLRRMLRGPGREGGAGPEALRDLAVVRAFLGGSGVVALCDAPWTLVYLALIYLFHPSLGLLATVCTVALLGLAWLNERITRPLIGQVGEATRQAARVADGGLRQAEAVVALGMQSTLARRWATLGDAAHRLQLTLGRSASAVNAVTRLTRQLVQVLMLGFGAWLVIHEHATPGIMLAATIVLGRALAPMEQLMAGWKQLVEARGAWQRLRAVLAAPEAAPRTPLPRPRGALAVENVSVQAPGSQRLLLRQVSLKLEPGQVLALVGASGSGKTTLARVLVGVTAPQQGCVRVDGADLDHWDPEARGRWVGYVPQDVSLFDGSIAENIRRMAPDADDGTSVRRAAERARVHDMLLRLPEGYDTPVGEGGTRLSGGQRQRVALARALYGEPSLVVMDEPDAHLDAEGEAQLVETIRQLRADGVTVVVATQRRGVLAAADLVLVMKDGQVDRLLPVQTNETVAPLPHRHNAAPAA